MVLDDYESVKMLRDHFEERERYINAQLKNEIDILVSAFNRGLHPYDQLRIWRKIRKLRNRLKYDKYEKRGLLLSKYK